MAGYGNRRAIVEGFDTRPPAGSARLRLRAAGVLGRPAAATRLARLGADPTGSILPVQLRPPLPGAGLENVIGADDRVMIPDTATIPWRCICHLEVIFDNGLKGYGTGWFAGPDTVITAAHCVWDPHTDERAAEIRMTPGRNGSLGPYGQFISHEYEVLKGWPGSDPDDFSLDVAAISVRGERKRDRFDEGVGEPLGYFGVAAFSDKKLEMLLVNTSGYPVEAAKPFATQWFNGGRIKGAEKDHITYMIDTEGGQSGSPIFFYEKETEQRLVVAIHTTGYYPNRGVRITDALLDLIQAGSPTRPRSGRPRKSDAGGTPAPSAAAVSAPRRPRRAAPACRRRPPAPARRRPRAPPAPARRPCPSLVPISVSPA